MYNPKYYPILKWKKGEQDALKNLSCDGIDIIPVIELVDEVDANIFFETLHSIYEGPIIFDTAHCDDDRSVLRNYINYVIENQLNAWPMIYANDLDDHKNELLSNINRLSIKLPITDSLEGYSVKEKLSQVISLSSELVIDVFLDAGVVTTIETANLAYTLYKNLLNENNTIKDKINTTIISLTSFPDQPSINAGDTKSYPRYDFKIFSLLQKEFKGFSLSYSDYGVTKFTETELDFKLLKYGPLPKIKYTTSEHYYVYKGEKNRLHNTFTRSYIDMCKEIVSQEYYSGKDFSFGDHAIYIKATDDTCGPGGSAQWVSYCANHHLVFVAKQLSSLVDT